MAGLSPAKVACLQAVFALFTQTGNDQFLRFGKRMTNLTLPDGTDGHRNTNQEVSNAIAVVRGIFQVNAEYTLEMAEAAAKACKTVWPDSSFPNLDPKFVFMLANHYSNKKPRIPSSYYRGFLVYLTELVGNNPSLKLTREHEEDDYDYDVEKFDVILQIAFDKAQEVYGEYGLSTTGPCGGDDYIRGGIESNWILSQVKDAMNSIKAETNRTIESEREALTQFESLVSELVIQSGKTVPNAFTHVCNQHTSHTRQTLETLKLNCETLSQFVDGSIDIINGTDRRDPDAME
ncbi:hypothetical protein V8F06_005397 [Rhypophila decipiens]